ncbi:MAG: hypothetical protein LBG11_00675 [Bifidobacteriaceae bacterium]|nr:hypothetical protein [Bifidobacteriaceae bacterium]
MSADRTGLGCFFLGRGPWTVLAALWLAATAAAVWLWPVVMLFDSLPDRLLRGIGAAEAVGVACLTASAWCLAPGMPTWERSAPRRARRWAAGCVSALLTAYAALGPLTRWLVYALPQRWVPRNSDGQTARSQFIEPPSLSSLLAQPRLLDTVAAGGAVVLAIGLLGRVLGTLVGLICYGAFIWVQGDATLCQVSPYGICLRHISDPYQPLAAIVGIAALGAAATVFWAKTGGAGILRTRTPFMSLSS